VLTSREFLKNVSAANVKVKSLKHIYLRDGSEGEAKDFSSLLKYPPWTGPETSKEDDLMMLLYTSGTTGLPKGVMLTHKNFLSNVNQCLAAIRLKPTDRFLCLLPLFHSFSWTTCMLTPLTLGSLIVIIETLLPFDPVIKAIWKYKITLFVGVPQIFGALSTKIKGAKAFVLKFLNPVRLCVSGAAPLPSSILKNFEKTFGIPLIEGYGLTEASPVVTLNPMDKRKIGTVGKPLPGVEIEIRDDQGKKVSTGQVGEIWIRGTNVMKGYYNNPAETKLVLTKEGWLKSGDLGKFDEEGYLAIVDRKKDLIIVKGLNVYPQEVEHVIAQSENVKEVAVVGKMDKETGEELIRAFVTARDGKTIDKAELFALCREELAAYKRPREIIVIDDMPKNALQKILKKELRER
jgi:long-chain acyl-CoA synthetase